MSRPPKYSTAMSFLSTNNEDAFIAYASSVPLDYDVEASDSTDRNERTLFGYACKHRLHKCVTYMLSRAAPSEHDLACVYGHENDELSEAIWTRYFACASELATRATLCRVAEHGCHLKLVQRLVVERNLSPEISGAEGWGDPDAYPLVLWFVTMRRRGGRKSWSPEIFEWLCARGVDLHVLASHVVRLVSRWSAADVAARMNGNDNDAKAFERVFWRLEAFCVDNSSKNQFREAARHLLPQEPLSTRDAWLIEMLLAVGVDADVPAAERVHSSQTCTHCNGTGRVRAIDERLVEQAKKRRLEDVLK